MSRVCVTITRTAGSAPRGQGTQMMVWANRTRGTIGGGALEWQAMQRARQMLTQGTSSLREVVALGPGLGQCCGGSVTLDYALNADATAPAGHPLWIWGAGHVGRALVATMAPLPAFAVTWVDVAADRFPKDIMDGVTPLVAAAPLQVVAHAPDTAQHLIVTYSHVLDLDLCHALLQRSCGGIGLIGSATKWARFKSRLADLGHGSADIARIACPIGDPSLGKHPQAIAIGVAVALMGQDGQVAMKGTG